jgi:hypothetical protein
MISTVQLALKKKAEGVDGTRTQVQKLSEGLVLNCVFERLKYARYFNTRRFTVM